MQFNNRWFGEAFATPAYPLDSREKTNFEALGGARSWMGGSSFGADAIQPLRTRLSQKAARGKAQCRLRSGRKGSAHRRFHRYAPSTPSGC